MDTDEKGKECVLLRRMMLSCAGQGSSENEDRRRFQTTWCPHHTKLFFNQQFG